jgi:hypothetical protein
VQVLAYWNAESGEVEEVKQAGEMEE